MIASDAEYWLYSNGATDHIIQSNQKVRGFGFALPQLKNSKSTWFGVLKKRGFGSSEFALLYLAARAVCYN